MHARTRPPARRRLPRLYSLAFPLAAALLLGLLPASARAQAGTISGSVVAEGSLRPLANAQVSVEGQAGRGAVTDGAGRFRITGVTGTSVTVDARLIGYRPVQRTVQVGASDVRFLLSERVVELNQVVVTGTAGGEQRRALGTSIAQVNATEVLQKTALPSVDALLNGRAAGVAVLPGTGMVGAGARVRIRGIGSFSLSADPLIYVDGVRVDNQTSTGISIQAFSSGVISRLNDFDPEQIESIEVLKGPAAATLYGTEAARGVINIITKKGTAGQTTYEFMGRTGANIFQNAAGRIATNWCHVSADGSSCTPTGTGPLLGLNTVVRQDSLGAPIFRAGRILDYSGSTSGGSGIFRFYASGGVNDDEGVDPTNAQRKISARTNLTITPSEKVDLQTNFGYINGHTTLSCEAGCGGLMWDSEYSTPANLPQFCAPGDIPCTWTQGFNGTPPAADAAQQDWQDLNRVTASATISYNPFGWMTNRLSIGTDVVQEGNVEYVPYLTNDTIANFWGPYAKGYRIDNNHQAIYNTYDFNSSARFNLPRNWVSKTSGGVQYYTNRHHYIINEGDFFPAPGLSTIASASVIQPTVDTIRANNTLGFFGQQEFSFADRLYLTGAARVDNNSAFGSEVHWVTYPKLSASYVISEEPAVQAHLPAWVNSLRLRAAYGASGQQPALNTALRTLTPVPGPATAILTPNTLGNPNLKPERVLGTELGFETGLLNDRVGIDFTYFHDVSKDAILSRGVAPGTGFGVSSQFFNAGQIKKQGVEALIRGQLVNRQSWGWDMTLNAATNSAKITQLSGTDTVIDLGSSAHRVGYAPFDWFSYRVVRVDQGPGATQASYSAATNTWTIPKASVYCDNGAGGETPCYNARGSVIAPKVYLGHSTPTFEGSWSNTIRFLNNFRLYGMFDWATGYRRLDNNIRIRCQIFHTCLEYVQPQNTDPKLLAQYFSGGTLREFTINDARYVKFRELSLSYDAPTTLAGRIGAKTLSVTGSARNLHTWTPYTGLDPESQFVAGSPASVDQAELPQLLTYTLTFHLSF